MDIYSGLGHRMHRPAIGIVKVKKKGPLNYIELHHFDFLAIEINYFFICFITVARHQLDAKRTLMGSRTSH